MARLISCSNVIVSMGFSNCETQTSLGFTRGFLGTVPPSIAIFVTMNNSSFFLPLQHPLPPSSRSLPAYSRSLRLLPEPLRKKLGYGVTIYSPISYQRHVLHYPIGAFNTSPGVQLELCSAISGLNSEISDDQLRKGYAF